MINAFSNAGPPSQQLSLLQYPIAPIGYLLLALGLVFNVYQGILFPPLTSFFTSDEQSITDSGVFLLYGATPRCLDWPALPMVFVYYLIALVHCSFEVVTHWSALHHITDIFTLIDQTVYQYLSDRTPYLLAGRVAQLLFSAGLLGWTIQTIKRASPALLPPEVGLLLLIIILTNSEFWTSAVIMRPEGLAYSLAVLTMVRLLFGQAEGRWYTLTTLLLTALLISQRLIFVFLLPFWLGGLLWRSRGRFSGSGFLRLGLGLTGCLLLTIPFLWTDTLVLVKAFAGGILAKTNSAAQASLFNWTYISDALTQPVTWLYGLGFLGSVVFVRQYPHRPIAWLLLGNALFYMVMVLRSPIIYPTHTLPIRILLLMPMAYGAAGVAQRLTFFRPVVRLALVGGLYAFGMVSESLHFEQLAHRTLNLHTTLRWINTLPANTKVLLQPDFEAYLLKNRTCLQRELSAIQNQELGLPKLKRTLALVGAPESRHPPLSLVNNLLEDERLTTLQHQLLLAYTPENQFIDPRFYTDQAGFINYYLVGTPVDVFGRSDCQYLITSAEVPGYRLTQKFDAFGTQPYYIYQR